VTAVVRETKGRSEVMDREVESRAPALDGIARVSRPRRILLDLVASSAGGQIKRAAAFLRRFRDFDPGAELVVVRQSGAVPFLEGGGRTCVVDVSLRAGPLRGARRMFWQNLFVPRLVERHRADTYISFSHYLPWTMPGGVHTVVGVSNLAPFSDAAVRAETTFARRSRLRLLKRTMLSSARRASKVVALSQTCRDILVAHGIPAGKIVVIPNGVDMPAGPPAAKADMASAYGIADDYLLYVSNFHRYKNFERLVEAYAQLPEPLRRRYRLVLVGYPDDAGYFADVQARIESLGIRDQVQLIPGLESARLGSLYAHATLFVFPSLVETCPNILLEAMSYGAPVLTGQIGPMTEFGGAAARYFDPLSPASIARQISETLAEPQALPALRERSRAQAQRYRWDDFTAKVVSLYSA
jgi:glycosyltransferase involved in cell wall biosynthesis